VGAAAHLRRFRRARDDEEPLRVDGCIVKVTIFTQYYEPEPCAAAKRITAIAKTLASCGFSVEIVTGFPNFPDGTIPKQYRRKLFTVEREFGLRITRVWTYASTKRSPIRRALNWLSVAIGAFFVSFLRTQRCSAVYVSVPPITLTLPALTASYVMGAPLFVDVRDSYPDVGINLGLWKRDSTVVKIVTSIVMMLYGRAKTIFCATEGVRDAVAARCPEGKDVQLITNGVDRIEPAIKAPFERRNGEFVAVYAGNMGLVSGLDVVLDAAEALKGEPLRFVFVGDGSEGARLRELAASKGLDNVEFTGVATQRVAIAALRDADISIIPLKRNIVDCMPSKMFDALSVGCPLLLSGDGEARRFIERAGAGWVVPAEDPAALAQTLRDAARDRDACRARGAAGNKYVLEHYDRRRLSLQVVRCIFDTVSLTAGTRIPQSAGTNVQQSLEQS
jgi:glycosyltransferase involved in cell wall biosynthesis